MSSLECTYTDPIVLDTSGNPLTPTDNSLPFQFSKSTCTGTLDATVSGSLNPELMSALGDTVEVFWLFAIFVSFGIFFFIGTYLYKR